MLHVLLDDLEEARAMKLTTPQLCALASVRNNSTHGAYMPYANRVRSFEACERRGLVEYRAVDQGHPRNGYALTDAGRDALKTAGFTTKP